MNKFNIVEKYHRMPVGIKASIAYFIASIVTTGIAYITTPFYTRLLTTDEFGQTSSYLAWVHVLGIIAMFCLSYGVFNNGMIDYPDKRDEFSFSMLALSNIITLFFSIVFLAVFPFIKPYLGMDYPLAILMCTLFFFQPAYNMWFTRQRYEYKYKGVVFFSVLSAFISSGVSLICIVLQPEGQRLYARLFGAEVSLILIYIGFYIYLGLRGKFKINFHYWKPALRFNFPLIPHYLSTYLLSSSDKLMISYLVGNSQNAFYSVAHSVASVSLIVWTAVNSSLVPYTYEKCKKRDFDSINKVTLPILVLFAGTCIVVIMLAPEVVKIMSTDEYMESIYVIPPLIGGVFFQVQYYIYANIIYYFKKTKYVMIGSFSATALNLILNYIFINKYGYLAAGYTTIFCYALQAIIDYLGMKKTVGKSVYNMKFVVGLSSAVVVIALLSNLIYNFRAIRYGILGIALVLIILFRNKILQIFSIIRSK